MPPFALRLRESATLANSHREEFPSFFHFDQERVLCSRALPICAEGGHPKFLPSLDHAICKDLVARKIIKDTDALWLVGRIIDGGNPQGYFPGDTLFTPSERRRGISIGNQTSESARGLK